MGLDPFSNIKESELPSQDELIDLSTNEESKIKSKIQFYKILFEF